MCALVNNVAYGFSTAHVQKNGLLLALSLGLLSSQGAKATTLGLQLGLELFHRSLRTVKLLWVLLSTRNVTSNRPQISRSEHQPGPSRRRVLH